MIKERGGNYCSSPSYMLAFSWDAEATAPCTSTHPSSTALHSSKVTGPTSRVVAQAGTAAVPPPCAPIPTSPPSLSPPQCQAGAEVQTHSTSPPRVALPGPSSTTLPLEMLHLAQEQLHIFPEVAACAQTLTQWAWRQLPRGGENVSSTFIAGTRK